jgi:hypothetical protein
MNATTAALVALAKSSANHVAATVKAVLGLDATTVAVYDHDWWTVEWYVPAAEVRVKFQRRDYEREEDGSEGVYHVWSITNAGPGPATSFFEIDSAMLHAALRLAALPR